MFTAVKKKLITYQELTVWGEEFETGGTTPHMNAHVPSDCFS